MMSLHRFGRGMLLSGRKRRTCEHRLPEVASFTDDQCEEMCGKSEGTSRASAVARWAWRYAGDNRAGHRLSRVSLRPFNSMYPTG